MTRRLTWKNARKILAVRLDSLGDVVMTTPALRALKTGHPKRSITLLTSPAGAKVAPYLPDVDDVIVYEAPWMKSTAPRRDSQAEYAMAAQLEQAGFDGAVIFTVFSQSPFPAAFLAFLANIPLRLAHSRENPYQVLTDWVPDTQPEDGGRHEVRRQLDLVKHVGASTRNEHLVFCPPEADQAYAARLLSKLGLNSGDPWVVIHPGASAASRRYPPESFAAAATQLQRESGCQIVFTGSRSEHELVQSIQDQMDVPSISLAGHLTLGRLGALLGLAPLMISNNTGPAHVAAAMGTPIVDLYALTNPQDTPWMVPSRVLSYEVPCKFCYKSVCPLGHHDCLRRITPAEVVSATLDLLQETRKKKRTREVTA